MAEKNHGGSGMVPEMMLLSLARNGNPSTLLPKLGSRTNEPCTNLQLSLGGLYDGDDGGGAPNSAPASITSFVVDPAVNSVTEGSEGNRFLQKEVSRIKKAEEIQMIMNPPENEILKKVNTLVSPSLAIPVLAAQTAFGNPALQRGVNVIKTNGITTTPGVTNYFKGCSSRNPSSVEGFPSKNSIEVPMGTHINNGANPMFFMQPKCVNLAPPTNFSRPYRKFIPNQQSNTFKLVPPFNCFLTTVEDPWNNSTNARNSLRKHYMGMGVPPFATSSSTCAKIPHPYQTYSNTKGQNISIIPQNTTRYNNNPSIHSNLFTNNKVASFSPVCNHTNGDLFMPQQSQFAEIINNTRTQIRRNLIDPPEYPCKRTKRDSYENEDTELQLMKKLPIVVTTGGNPNGKKIEGLLYKYGSDQEVTIVCACHGCFFTPEEFVRHAGAGGGGDNIENPRQYISIMDYPNYLLK